MVYADRGKGTKKIMKWKQIEKLPEKKPKKKGTIVKPQFLGSVLVLDIYEDKVWESRYCIDVETGEHGYRKPEEGWKKGKLITCIGGDPMETYMYYGSNRVSLGDLKFDSEEERKETNEFLGRKDRKSFYYEAIESMERMYDREKRWEAEKNLNRRRKDLMDQVPDMPEGIREWIYEKESEEEYIFWSKEKGKWGCSSCAAEIKELKRLSDSGKVRHNDLTKCPKCGKTLVAKKRTSRMRKRTSLYLINEVNEKASVIRYVDVDIEWGYRWHSVVVDEAIRIMAYKIGKNPRRKKHVEIFYEQWMGFGTGNVANKRAKPGYLYPGNYGEVLKNTVYAEGIRILEQLAAAGKRMNYNKLLIGIDGIANFENVIEYLFKGRFDRIMEETIDHVDWWGGGNYYGKLRLNGKTLKEIFGISDKQKINRIREENGGEKMLLWMRWSDAHNQKIPQNTLQYMIDNEIIPEGIEFIEDRMSPQQIQNYIEKQRAAGYGHRTALGVLEQWEDYLDMCEGQNKNTDDEMVYRPRDLKLRHDQAITDANQLEIVKAMRENKDIRAAEAEKMREKYPQAEQNLDDIRERYEYQNDEYLIIVPHDLVEIIEDGQALHHCAGSAERYFDRIESRETYICFLRRIDTPGIPFYTIEVEPSGTIRQHRSYLDEEPGIEQIRGFLREWQKVIKKRVTEEDKRLARISREKREQNIEELKRKNNTRVLQGLAKDFMDNPLDFEETA